MKEKRKVAEDYAGGGMVGKAKRLLSGRKRQIDDAVDEATKGEKTKKYAKGGAVRGCGAAKKGVRKAKMY